MGNKCLIPHQIGHFHLRKPRLTGTQHFAGTTKLQIFLGNHKAVVTFPQHPETRLGGKAERRLVQQHAVAGHRAAANPAPQLMQLGKPQPLGVFDDHQTGVGHIHAHFDNRGGNQ